MLKSEYKHCKLCKNEDIKEIIWHTKKRDIFYYKCSSCKFIYKAYNSQVNKEKELKIYNSHNNSIKDPRYVSFFQEFISEYILPIYKKNFEILDYGSGPEPVLQQILKRDHTIDTAIYDPFFEPSEEYKNKKYDLVISTEVFEHFNDPLKEFGNIISLLNKNGYLAIMTLFNNNSDNSFVNWHYIRDESHVSFYNLETFRFLSEKFGLKIIKSDNFRKILFKKI